ncbi:hypothetical protein KAFR_0D04150 [Kazachstania africana CBS 2517]|uniref:Early meiotic induction protein 1 n=1 Tax=Kazachstania africana (strain ATCC 22294 / BCRC 22015 / CBS 2517 / CECT 1963 / NBRC 1671 / NRRL Y-8276) TaxID=1071382 RepID=H2AUL3_KAZAF|nr:hypothetical protein KAFR_0D04150 [Kazachstania africana CBS 2517]CCF58063.1 hypothetical protein KAFR_0D04150 [Kazachstania africana CBS 2517]
MSKDDEVFSKYPTTMSCMEAFDQLTICYSIGGQFRNYYRHGKFNSCDDQLKKFKFCLFNSKNPIKVQEWYKAKSEHRKSTNALTDDLIWNERS